MFYDYKKSHVPNTLHQLKKQIKSFKSRGRKKHTTLYGKLNKAYRTINWDKLQFTTSEIKQAIEDQNFKRWRRIVADKQVAIIKKHNKYFVKRQNLQGICLLRQVCSVIDTLYFKKEPKPTKKIQYKPFHFNSAYRGDIFLFSYPITLEWKAELLTDFLHTKQFLFDEDSPHWKGMPKLRYFCLKNLMNSKVEKWEYQVQRFLAKND